jgi:hypothetical protein
VLRGGIAALLKCRKVCGRMILLSVPFCSWIPSVLEGGVEVRKAREEQHVRRSILLHVNLDILL